MINKKVLIVSLKVPHFLSLDNESWISNESFCQFIPFLKLIFFFYYGSLDCLSCCDAVCLVVFCSVLF